MTVLILTCKATLLIAVAFLAQWFMRGTSFRLRFSLTSATFVLLLLIPILDLTLPQGDLRAWPSVGAGWFESSGEVASAHSGFHAGSIRDLAGMLSANPRVEGFMPLPEILTWIWFLGFALLLLGQAWALIWTLRLDAESSPVTEGAWLQDARTLELGLAISRRVRIKESSRVTSPMTAGSLHPCILLPKDARNWSSSRRKMVLAHELVHVSRHDWLRQQLARFVRSIYWLSPFSWLLFRKHGLQCEQACDEAVIDVGADPYIYARELVAIANSTELEDRVPTSLGALPVSNPSTLERRLQAIYRGLSLKEDRVRGSRLMPIFLTLLAIGSAVLFPARAGEQDQGSVEAPRALSPVPESAWMEVRARGEDSQEIHMRLFGQFRLQEGRVRDLAAGGVCFIEANEGGAWRHRFELRSLPSGPQLSYFEAGVRQALTGVLLARWQELLSAVNMAQVHNDPIDASQAGKATARGKQGSGRNS